MHLNVRGVHMCKRSKVVVVSTTSSLDTEVIPIKAETDLPMVATAEIHSPLRNPSPELIGLSSALPQLSSSDVDLTVTQIDLQTENPILQMITSPVTSATASVTYTRLSGTTPTTTQLQVGVSTTSANVWRDRFYTLAAHTRFWINEISRAGVSNVPTTDQLMDRWAFVADWTSGTDIATPLSQLATDLAPYYEQMVQLHQRNHSTVQ